MRIGLVIPPSGFMLDDRVFPSLGILKVAAALESAFHSVSVLDLSSVGDFVAETEAWLRSSQPFDACGITATTPQMPAAAAIADAIRRLRPATRCLLGGPHATLLHAARTDRARIAFAALVDRFDTIVTGDGEVAIFDAIRSDAPPLIDADDPASHRFLKAEQLATLPWPARHQIDLASYRFTIDGVPATSLIGQLGCPFQCGFCGGRSSPTFRRVRLRPPADIVAEIRWLYEVYDYRGFMFLDDELNVNRALPELCSRLVDLQLELGTRFVFRGLLKAELFTDAQAALLRRAGFRSLLIGFESGSPRILTNINKRATVEENTNAVAIARRSGLGVKALMSIGHPGESSVTIAETKAWLLAVKPDEFDVTILTVYPGTPYYDSAVGDGGASTYHAPKTGDRLYMQDIDQFVDTPYYKGVPGNYRAYVWTDALTRSALVAERDALERSVRAELGIPWPTGSAAIQYEHSMGQR